MPTEPEDIVAFWRSAGPKKWFQKSDAFDNSIEATFLDDVLAARSGKLEHWIEAAESCLALILLLDQFPRNIFRGAPDMFRSDAMAVAITKRAIELGHDVALDDAMRAFVYMPLMHSEQLDDQQLSVALFTKLDAPENLRHALEHARIVEAFGRFPHRNDVLDRPTTAAERAFLDEGGFAG